MVLQRFEHTPLNRSEKSVRLLRILSPKDADEYIICEVFDADVDTEYVCLSYLCGPPDPAQPIVLNGKLFDVGPNLYSFLDVAKRKYPGILLWTDAICINQGDEDEKGHQVALMGKIYARAKSVTIWLGPEKLAVKDWKTLTDYSRWLKEGKWDEGRPWFATTEKMPKVKAWRQVKAIYQNEYWSRAWIVQETMLARSKIVLIGLTEIAWEDFEAVYRTKDYGVMFDFEAAHPDFHGIDKFLGAQRRALTSFHLYQSRLRDLLVDNFDTRCTLYHDKVYALLSLAIEGKDYQIDYRLSKDELYFHTLLQCAKQCICIMYPLLVQLYGRLPTSLRARVMNGAGDLADEELPATRTDEEVVLEIAMTKVTKSSLIDPLGKEEKTLVNKVKIWKRILAPRDGTHLHISLSDYLPTYVRLTISYTHNIDKWTCTLADQDEYASEYAPTGYKYTNILVDHVTVTGSPLDDEWTLLLDQQALFILAACQEPKDHQCPETDLRPKHRFVVEQKRREQELLAQERTSVSPVELAEAVLSARPRPQYELLKGRRKYMPEEKDRLHQMYGKFK